eukprot:scaffold2748_cov154-Isochrysis_galbana.AAC.4
MRRDAPGDKKGRGARWARQPRDLRGPSEIPLAANPFFSLELACAAAAAPPNSHRGPSLIQTLGTSAPLYSDTPHMLPAMRTLRSCDVGDTRG